VCLVVIYIANSDKKVNRLFLVFV